MSHLYLVVMLGATARVSSLIEAVVIADGRGAMVFVAGDARSSWRLTPFMRIQAEFEESDS